MKDFDFVSIIGKSGVYELYSLSTNKFYIGSSNNLYKRLHKHKICIYKGDHNNLNIKEHCLLHGSDDIKVRIIISFDKKLPVHELRRLEEFHIWENIKKYNRCSMNIFKYPTNSSKNDWSDFAKLNRIGFRKGKIVSDETKKKMSEAAKGKSMSEVAKQKLRDLPENNIKIIALTLNGEFYKEFKNITEASKYFNTITTYICDILKKKKKTCKGYRFLYKTDYDKLKDKKIERVASGKTTEIEKYDLSGNLISNYLSIKEAEIDIGIKGCNSNISACCKGRKKSAYGFIWKYKTK